MAPAAPAAPAPGALCLDARVEGAGLDAEQLRLQLERELGLAVARGADGAPPCLIVEAPTLAATRVAFARADGTRTERTIDVSSTGAHTLETIALLAANLVRDEAAELLADLQEQAAAAAAQASAMQQPAPAPPEAPPAPPAQQIAPPEPPRRRGCDPTGLRRVAVGTDFVPELGSSIFSGSNVERGLSLNVLGSVTGAVRGFELSLLFAIDRRSLCGVQVSGIFNLVMGPVDGAQISLINVSRGAVEGAQLGLISIAAGPVEGLQASLVNVNTRLDGAQLGLVNVAAGTRDGVQIGLANVTAEDAAGAQIGLLNVGGALRGAQVGLANISHGRVDGAMVGLLNVGEYADAAIAPISILSHGRTHVDVWGTDAGLAMAGVEHGSKHVHNIFAIGATAREGRGVFAFSYGLGARLFSDPHFFVDVDAIAYGLLVRNPDQDRIEITTIDQLRFPVSLRLHEAVAIFVAPSVNVSIAQSDDLITNPSLYGSTRLTSSEAGVVVRIWPGVSLGGRFF